MSARGSANKTSPTSILSVGLLAVAECSNPRGIPRRCKGPSDLRWSQPDTHEMYGPRATDPKPMRELERTVTRPRPGSPTPSAGPRTPRGGASEEAR